MNKHKTLSVFNPRLLLLFLIGLGLTAISFFVYRNLIIVVTTLISTVLVFLILRGKVREIDIEINEQGFIYEKDKVKWEDCIAWSIVDLGEDLEFVIQTTGFTKNFYYFYTKDNSEISKEFINYLSQQAVYDENVAYRNQFHNLLRYFDLV